MKGHKFPMSTTGVYTPGVGITITRANIELTQAARVKEGHPPYTSEELVRAFLPANIGHPTQLRRWSSYVARASWLMGSPKPVKAVPKKGARKQESQESE